jgi:Protein of Unknown function (DUF2784)
MTLFQRLCLFLADAILVMHAAFIAFVVVGLVLIWVGWFRRWPVVRSIWFRTLHLAAIAFVAAQALGGAVCPLTNWEDQLRRLAGAEERYAGSFIQHWLHRLIFFDLDERVFTVSYVAFFLAAAVSFWVIPPRSKQRPDAS